MLTWSNTLFYIVFLGQIFLTSFYFANKIHGRMKHVLETYPPSKYPKLYPKPLEYYTVWQWVFKVSNRVIFVLGFVILYLVMFVVDHATFADDGYISEVFPGAYGIIQFGPLMLLEFSEFSQLKLMRTANKVSTRTADLRPRRLFDFVSPMLFGIAVFLYVASILFDLYAHEFEFSLGSDAGARAIVLTVSNLFFIGVGSWIMRGRNQNPHQASEDRARQISTALSSYLYLSMALSVFFMTRAADDLYNLDFLDATMVSLYFQAIVFLSLGHILRSLKVEDIDFDVYKNGAAVT